MRGGVEDAVDLAEARSACTCEACGEPGRLFKRGGWFMTACEAHGEGAPVTGHRPDMENVHVVWRFVDGKRVVSARRYLRDTDTFVDVDPSTLDLDEED
jgi:hypothetical protein